MVIYTKAYKRFPSNLFRLTILLFLAGCSLVLSSETSGAESAIIPLDSLEKTLTIDLADQVTMEFVLVPAGNFIMGSTGSSYEKPPHKVTIPNSFYLGKYEVTQEQWQVVMGKGEYYFNNPKHPVETVSWLDCQAFLKKLQSAVSSL